MKNEPLVTVAIAAYNVEKFLINGVRYIQDQTYQNIEIILVDDGSTDHTPSICDEIGASDSRVRVFHKTNGGLGSARNVGIDNAHGEYLYFFDVDDSIGADFIEQSVTMAEEKQVDLIIYGYYARCDGDLQEEKIVLSERMITSNAELKQTYCDELLWMKHGNGFAWNKFYRMSFLRKYDFHFGNQRIQQDEPFNMQLYPKLERVLICPKVYYHYVIYSSGNAGSRYIENKADIITDVYHRFMNFYHEWIIDDKRVLSYIQNRYITGIFAVVTGNYFHKKCPFTELQRLNAIQKELNRPELAECFADRKLDGGKNPVNALQAWAFNHRSAGLLVASVRLKKMLKKIAGGK